MTERITLQCALYLITDASTTRRKHICSLEHQAIDRLPVAQMASSSNGRAYHVVINGQVLDISNATPLTMDNGVTTIGSRATISTITYSTQHFTPAKARARALAARDRREMSDRRALPSGAAKKREQTDATIRIANMDDCNVRCTNNRN